MSTIVGRQARPIFFIDMRRSLLRLYPTSVSLRGGGALPAVLQATRTIPIVFVIVPDPVGNGYVASLSRPGGNATGFLVFEYSLAAKWVEILNAIAPNVTRAGVLREANYAHGIG